jgi:hypothetical protein
MVITKGGRRVAAGVRDEYDTLYRRALRLQRRVDRLAVLAFHGRADWSAVDRLRGRVSVILRRYGFEA